MPIPESDRVSFAKNPLERVITQLRFPPILEIASQIPSVFQNTVREAYPLYEEGEIPELPEEVQRLVTPSQRSSQTFQTSLQLLLPTCMKRWPQAQPSG